MELTHVSDHQKKVMDDFLKHVNEAINILDQYEPNRPGSLAFTKLEEAILWAQVAIAIGKEKEAIVV